MKRLNRLILKQNRTRNEQEEMLKLLREFEEEFDGETILVMHEEQEAALSN